MKPKPPADLSKAGAALWRAVLEEYELSPGESRLLTALKETT